MIFAKEIAFCKRKTPKFSRLRRGYTPSNYSKHWWRCSKSKYSKCNYSKSNYCNIVHAAALAKHFSNLHAAIARSTHAQNIFTVWLARWDLIIYDLRAATALSTHAQNVSYSVADAAETLSYLIYERLWRSLHMHKTFGKEKVRRRREKIEIQELKRSFLVLKTWKID